MVTGLKQWHHPAGKKKTPSTGVPAGWEHRQHDGTVFFKNVVTGEKQWDHPSGKGTPRSTGGIASPDGNVELVKVGK